MYFNSINKTRFSSNKKPLYSFKRSNEIVKSTHYWYDRTAGSSLDIFSVSLP